MNTLLNSRKISRKPDTTLLSPKRGHKQVRKEKLKTIPGLKPLRPLRETPFGSVYPGQDIKTVIRPF